MELFYKLTGLMLITLINGGTKAENLLWLDPATVVVRHGDPVSVTCNTTAEKYEIMDWEVSQGETIRVTDQKLIWNVSSLTEWNINPSCYITVDSLKGIMVENYLKLIIYKIPDSVSISTVGDIGEMIEGQQYELQCDVQNVAPVKFLTVNWYKGDTLVDSTSFTDSIKTPQTLSHSLQISPRRDDHGDQYTCVAVLELGPDGPQPPPTVTSDPFNITVHYKPEAHCLDWSPLINTFLNSYPYVVGNPPPFFTWFRGQSLVFNKRLGKDDSGQYFFSATNKLNSTSCLINITVEYGPKLDCPSVYEGQEYEHFSDICTVTALPSAHITWYKDGRMVESPRYLTRRDNGTYNITAQNKHGTAHHLLTIHVLSVDGVCPPYLADFELDPEDLVVRYGDPVSVNCTSYTHFTELNWTVSPEHVLKADNQTVSWTVDSLRDWDVQPECYIKLDEEQCKKTLNLTIYKTPDSVSISTVGDTEPMVEGKPYKLQCDVKNVAPVKFLTVKWYKGDTLVDSTSFTDPIKTPQTLSHTLQITPGKDDNGTQYSCVAVLELGPDGPPLTVISDPFSIIFIDRCPIALQPRKMVVEFGKPASANCSTFLGHTGIGFEASQGGVQMTKDSSFITWRVQQLEQWNIKVDCYINLLDREQCQIGLPVTVYKTPDSVTISTVGDTEQMVEGKKYELQCDVKNVAPVKFLTVNWYKGDTLVDSRNFTDPKKTPRTRSPTLQITPSRDDHGDQYTCVAVLELGPDGPQPPPTVTSDPFSVTVHYGPEIEPGQDTVEVYEGREFTLTCKAEGNPEPNLIWSFKNQTVSTGGRQTTLIISGATSADGGVYTCTATNNNGRQIRTVLLVIKDIPDSLSISTVGHTGPMVEGQQYELQCDVPNMAPDRFLTVKWYKGDTLGPNVSFTNIKISEDGSPTFPITPSRNDNGAQYRCEVELELGPEETQPPPKVTSDLFIIAVYYGPEMESGQESVEVYEGREVTLTCTAEGNPEPNLIWSFKNQTKTTGGRQTTLIISGATSADGGVYTCTATNNTGKQIRTVLLVIKDYRLLIILIVIIIVLIIILICIIAYLMVRRRGKYDVQSNDKRIEMKLLNG